MKILRSASLPKLVFFLAGAWITDRSVAWYATTQINTRPIAALSAYAAPVAPQAEPVQWSVPGGQSDTQLTLTDKYAPKFWPNISTLYKGEILQLHFATPNAPYLGLVDPSGHFFYLVFPAETVVGELKPLVESKSFIALKSLSINTGTLKADPYTYGIYTNQPVFTQSGTYTFLLGENLHVDDPGFLDQVVVRYVHVLRSARVSPNTAMD